MVAQVEEFANGRAAMVAGAGALQAAGALDKNKLGGFRGIDTRFAQLFGGVFLRTLATITDEANEALSENTVESGDEVVGLDAHVDEAADDVGDVVGVDGGEDEVAGERRLDGDLRGFLVADFPDHDFVGVVAKDGAQSAGKGETLLFVDGNLGDAAQLIFDGVFDGDDFVLVGFDFVDGGVESGGLAGAGGAGNKHHAIRLTNIAAEAFSLFGRKAHDVEVQALEFFGEGFLVEDAKDRVFAVVCGHDGDAQVNVTALYLTRKRPSWGTRRSAMSRSLRTLMRERTVECHSLAMGCMACWRTPSMRYFTATSVSRASM